MYKNVNFRKIKIKTYVLSTYLGVSLASLNLIMWDIYELILETLCKVKCSATEQSD